MSTRFIEPSKTKVVHVLPERLERKRKACDRIGRAYIFDRRNDKLLLETSILAQKHPTMIRDTLLTLSRVKLIPNCFELDSEGRIDKDFKAREALVWSVSRKVMDPLNPETVALSHATIRHGVFQRPFAEIERGENNEIVKSEIKFWKNMFYIEFTEANVKKVLEEFNYQYRNLVIAIGSAAGDSWNTGKTYEVKNLREWLEVDLDTLVSANQMGVLSSDYGGHVKFLRDREEKKKALEAEVASFTTGSGSGSSRGSSTNARKSK